MGAGRHPGLYPGNAVTRSLIVGDTLWTTSEAGAYATDASTLKGGDWLPFD